jgi:hypothetical protein
MCKGIKDIVVELLPLSPPVSVVGIHMIKDEDISNIPTIDEEARFCQVMSSCAA